MLGTVLYGTRDIRGIALVAKPSPMGHEYCGVVEEVGSAVTAMKPGQFVIGSFFTSDNTCAHCRAGYQTSCEHRKPISGAQSPFVRVANADGTLVATPEMPSDDMLPSLLTLSDVLSTGWFVALAREFGATDIISERGDRNTVPRFSPENRKANQVVVDLVKEIATEKNATPAQVALAWLLAQKPWIVPIPGTTKLHRLEENLGGANVELTRAELERIDEASSQLTIHGARYSEGAQKMIDR